MSDGPIVLHRTWQWFYDAPPRGATAKQYEKAVKNLGGFNSVQVRRAAPAPAPAPRVVGRIFKAPRGRTFGATGTILTSKRFPVRARRAGASSLRCRLVSGAPRESSAPLVCANARPPAGARAFCAGATRGATVSKRVARTSVGPNGRSVMSRRSAIVVRVAGSAAGDGDARWRATRSRVGFRAPPAAAGRASTTHVARRARARCRVAIRASRSIDAPRGAHARAVGRWRSLARRDGCVGKRRQPRRDDRQL